MQLNDVIQNETVDFTGIESPYFLLGLLSPGLMARRLWAHPAYATATGHPWETL